MFKRKAIFEHNKQSLQTGTTYMIRDRRRGNDELTMCGNCFGFFSEKYIWKHKLKCCPSTTPSSLPVSSLIMPSCSADVPEEFITEIVAHLRNDDIGNICRDDQLIITLGNKLWAKNVKRERKVILSQMRRMGHLLLLFRKEVGQNTLNGAGMFDQKLFSFLEKAIRKATEKEGGEIKDGLKVGLGYLLKNAANVQKAVYIMSDQLQAADEIDCFFCVLDLNWDSIFYRSQVAIASRHEDVLIRPPSLPLEDDVAKLKAHIIFAINELTNDPYLQFGSVEYVRLRTLLVTRLTLYNGRRGGEPARLLLKEWEDAKTNAWINTNMVVDDAEQKLVQNCKIACQSGKNPSKLVSVHIPEDCVTGVFKLTEERQNAGINPRNPYLFPATQHSMGHAEGWASVHATAKTADLKKPGLITATRYRHRASTYFAALDLHPSSGIHSTNTWAIQQLPMKRFTNAH